MTASPASLAANLPESRILQGLGLMFLAMLLAPLVDLFSKLATDSASPTLITAVRFFLQALCMLPIVIWNRSWRKFSWTLCGYHALRALIITVSMICFVGALAVMELADALAIFFVEPIILTVLSSIFLKEVIGWRRYTACAVGFVGALIVIRPSFQELGFVTLLPIVTAFCVAIFALLTRALAHREDPWAMQFQMALWGMPLCGIMLFIGERNGIPFMLPSWPDWLTFGWMAGVGIFAAICGILNVYAFRAAPASVLAPVQYFEIVSATILGWMVFGDLPDPVKWLGIAIIVGSGLYIIWRERRLASLKPVTRSAKLPVNP